jgi:CBS domain-containing protein
MLDEKISALPVVDDGDALVGIISATDFLEVARQVLEREHG